MVKKAITIFSVLGFVAFVCLGSAVAQTDDLDNYITGCYKDGKKFNRVGAGTDPGKDCKSNQNEATVATKTLTDDLQDQIDAIRDSGISSMIGGGHNSSEDGADTFYMPLYNWFRLEGVGENSDEPATAKTKVAVTGWLTNLVVNQNEPTGGSTLQTYQYMVNGAAVDLSPAVADNFCVTTGDTGDGSTMCMSEGCAQIEEGDTLSVRVIAATAGEAQPNISPTRWTGRFVETDADCPGTPPANICTDYTCPGASELICDPEVGLSCTGEGADCASAVCPEGTVLSQCDTDSFACEVVVEE